MDPVTEEWKSGEDAFLSQKYLVMVTWNEMYLIIMKITKDVLWIACLKTVDCSKILNRVVLIFHVYFPPTLHIPTFSKARKSCGVYVIDGLINSLNEIQYKQWASTNKQHLILGNFSSTSDQITLVTELFIVCSQALFSWIVLA